MQITPERKEFIEARNAFIRKMKKRFTRKQLAHWMGWSEKTIQRICQAR